MRQAALELVAIDSGTAESSRQLKTPQFKNRFQDLRPGSSALQMDPQFRGEVHSSIRISWGAAILSDHGRTCRELKEAADRALYRAKREAGQSGAGAIGHHKLDQTVKNL